ncbi:LptF/LptG family permease [Desulfovibrio sp. OttesenSCG-928-F20]|nr:LptF/LptG family permease [Desulfovibrio sp. OttesenSCG-928-M16]MDL2290618.1 LptF/LptG family permease [Desulfovibrio sp. OttesenSCG-928-F20]
MSLLSRYLLRQNLFMLFAILLIGTGLYVLTDMFERLDNFLESGIGGATIFYFFLLKIPTIVSLILPAVYLLSLVVQINFLERSRELVALAAGGVSPMALFRFVLFYGIIWALTQLLFSQVLGIVGERAAGRIWQENVRGHILEEMGISGLWFTEGRRIIHIGKAYPAKNQGKDITVYVLDASNVGIEEIYRASDFVVEQGGVWQLLNGQRLEPAAFSSLPFDKTDIRIDQDLKTFQATTGSGSSGIKGSQLSLVELGKAIERLDRAGSNVEGLRTAWHGKLAYAASIVVMGILALVVSRQTPNIYKAAALSILIVFFYYFINTMCLSMGEKGLLSPFLGAWFANSFFFFGGLLCLAFPAIIRKIRE